MKSNKNGSVTFSNEEYTDLIEELKHLQEYRSDTGIEMAYMFHFLRYYNLNKLYDSFKVSPPDDDPDDEPFMSYR